MLLAAGGVYWFTRDDGQTGAFDPDAPYLDASRPVAERVDDLLGRMTLDEKLGQMTQAERKEVGAGRSPRTRWARCCPAAARCRPTTRRRAGPTCTTRSRPRPWPPGCASR
ncbi:hypothetical protein ACFQY4_29795 [Catellatospora bangladeshensis]|uniref:hypothetical protein n=1 Tax=Catellatospora bangladeshensis TaxID=310355 RepID=UPI00361B2C58